MVVRDCSDVQGCRCRMFRMIRLKYDLRSNPMASEAGRSRRRHHAANFDEWPVHSARKINRFGRFKGVGCR